MYSNQFEQEVVKGSLDLHFNPNTLTCKISSSEGETLNPGDPVKIEDSVGGIPNVLLATADTDNIFGFVVRNLKKSELVAGDKIEVSLAHNVMYLEAGAAIARGAMVYADVSESKVLTAAGTTNPIIGFALDKAAADEDLIRVFILTPMNLTNGYFADLIISDDVAVTDDFSVGGDLTVTGDATLSANLIKSVNNYSAGAGALPIDKDIIFLTTGGAEALTLADGVAGQELKIIMVSDGGDGTLTPDNYLNGSTLTFDDDGDSAHLVFDGTNWCNVGTPTATVA